MENRTTHIRILIITEQSLWDSSKEDLERFLADEEKYQIVGSTTSGREGIEIAKMNQLDIVLLNINIADMHSFEVLQSIKLLQLSCRYIFITTANDPKILRQAWFLGADNFLSEPIDQDETINCINYVLKKNQGSD